MDQAKKFTIAAVNMSLGGSSDNTAACDTDGAVALTAVG
jgi:hypothetical protein